MIIYLYFCFLETESRYVAQAVLERAVLPRPPQCWDYKRFPINLFLLNTSSPDPQRASGRSLILGKTRQWEGSTLEDLPERGRACLPEHFGRRRSLPAEGHSEKGGAYLASGPV
jgi:hypothetical protein